MRTAGRVSTDRTGERELTKWKEIKRERYLTDRSAKDVMDDCVCLVCFLCVFLCVCVLPWRGWVQRTCICRVQRRKVCPSGPGSASSCGPQRPKKTEKM